MPPVVNEFFDWLKDFSSSPWFYAIVFTIALLDSILPIVPSETLVIIGGVAAGGSGADGSLNIAIVIACGALGAFVGDNLSYEIARTSAMRRLTRSASGHARYEQVVEQIHKRGGLLLITARFIPGGRTILTLSCGITGQPRPWFVKWAAIAATIWATYAAMLGYLGGRTFHDNPTLAFGVAFGTAVSITVVVEAVRWALKRRASE